MAIHHDTDIYKTGYELFDVVVTLVTNMNKQYNRRLGDKLLDGNVEIMLLIFDVNTEPGHRERIRYLDAINRRVAKMELVLRFVADKFLAAPIHIADANRLITSVGKQATGWKNYELKQLNASAS